MESRRQKIRSRVLNGTLGKMIRAVDAILDAYVDRGEHINAEAEHVVKLALLLMLTNYFDENDIVLLMDSSSLALPRSLSESSQFDIRCLLRGNTDSDAPPGPDDSGRIMLRADDDGKLSLEDKDPS